MVLSSGLVFHKCIFTISILFSNQDIFVTNSVSSELTDKVNVQMKKVISKMLNLILDEVVKTSENLGRCIIASC